MIETLRALAEPNRLQIVEFLHEGPRPVGDIVDRLRLRQPQVSKHLRVLTAAGLVQVHQAAQQRIYELRPQPFKELDVWLESYRDFWDESLDRLDDYLSKLQKEKMKREKEKKRESKR
jgi:DNA-binding transcriptional ArsR family regulator